MPTRSALLDPRSATAVVRAPACHASSCETVRTAVCDHISVDWAPGVYLRMQPVMQLAVQVQCRERCCQAAED